MPRELGDTARKLKETYEQYPTIKAAADALKVSSPRIGVLCKKLGITKWNHPRRPETAAKVNVFICKNCEWPFSVPKYIKSPHTFCSKKCQGEYAGKHYGFGKEQNEKN
jgi:hypothetical protein